MPSDTPESGRGAIPQDAEVGALRVLVIDDDVALCRALDRLLLAFGCSVRIHTTTVAFDELRDDEIDVVLVDASCVPRTLRSFPTTPPVVLMSGMAHEELRALATELGAADVVAKPFDPDFLLCTIRRVGSRSPN